jgi:four helix bundle protein
MRLARLLQPTGCMSDKPWDLQQRTMDFGVAVFLFCRSLPRDDEGRTVAGQLRRAGSSTAANYRAAKRGRSTREFIAKIGQAIEEGDECGFWLAFSCRVGLCSPAAAQDLVREANELVAILTASLKTAKARAKKQPKESQ